MEGPVQIQHKAIQELPPYEAVQSGKSTSTTSCASRGNTALSAGQTYQLEWTDQSFCLKESTTNTTIYHARRQNRQRKADIELYQPTSSNPDTSQATVVGLAKLIPDSKSAKYVVSRDGIGKLQSVEWWEDKELADTARYIDDGEKYYRFEIKAPSAEGYKRQHCSYALKRTNERSLGSSWLAARDYKIVDETTGEVLAVYLESGRGWAGRKARIVWHHDVDTELEAAALVILFAVLERSKRNLGQISRALNPGQ